MNRTAADYEVLAIGAVTTAQDSNPGTSQAMYWLARADVYATLALAAATSPDRYAVGAID